VMEVAFYSVGAILFIVGIIYLVKAFESLVSMLKCCQSSCEKLGKVLYYLFCCCVFKKCIDRTKAPDAEDEAIEIA